jgi:hypothetical protein
MLLGGLLEPFRITAMYLCIHGVILRTRKNLSVLPLSLLTCERIDMTNTIKSPIRHDLHQCDEVKVQKFYCIPLLRMKKTTISLSHCASKRFKIKRHTKARSYIPTAFSEYSSLCSL